MQNFPIPPNESARERLILEKLGINGWGRWQYFQNCFSGKWGEGKQKPFSPRSQDMLFKALSIIDFPENAKPSLFLTDSGHCELAWSDDAGNDIQIEFGPSEFEVYIEGAGIEQTLPNQELTEFLSRHFSPAA